MTRRMLIPVLLALSLEVVVTGYGAVAAHEQAHATCVRDHGTVEARECVVHGHPRFDIPL